MSRSPLAALSPASLLLIAGVCLGGCALSPAARVGTPGLMTAKLDQPSGSDAAPAANQPKGYGEEREPAEAQRQEHQEAVALKPASSSSRSSSASSSTRATKKPPAQKRAPSQSAPAQDRAPSAEEEAPDPVEIATSPSADAPIKSPIITPPSFDVRGLSRDECAAFLDDEGVQYERAEGPDTIALYIRPKGAIGAVSYEFDGRSAVHEVMDCRLVAALVQWGPRLRSLGILKVRHISAYRPGARVARTGRRSGHASALALDLRFIELEDGRVLDVLEDWGDRKKGAAPCEDGRGAGDEHPELRRLVCETIDDGIFQTIITPHRDTLHDNHVHLELVPEVEWTFIR